MYNLLRTSCIMGQQVNNRSKKKFLVKTSFKIERIVPIIRPETKWSYHDQVLRLNWSLLQ
jgi:hypothetical protein